MIRKSEKFLALSLSLVSLVSSMGSINIHAMDGKCAKSDVTLEYHEPPRREPQPPVMGKYEVPAIGKDILSVVFSDLTGRNSLSGEKDSSLEIIPYEDFLKSPLLSKIVSLKEKISKGTASFVDYYSVSQALSKEGKALSDKDADKFITEYLKVVKCLGLLSFYGFESLHYMSNSYRRGVYRDMCLARLTGEDLVNCVRNIGLPIISMEDFKREYMKDEFMNRIKNHTITYEEIFDLCDKFYKSGRKLSEGDSYCIIDYYFFVN